MNIDTFRELALQWFEKHTNKLELIKEYFPDRKPFIPNYLEIEEMYRQERLKPHYTESLSSYIKEKKNQDECSGFMEGYQKASENLYTKEEVIELVIKIIKVNESLL